MAEKKKINRRYWITLFSLGFLGLLVVLLFLTPSPQENKPLTIEDTGLLKMDTLMIRELYIAGSLFQQDLRLIKYPLLGWYVNGIQGNNQYIEEYVQKINHIRTVDFLNDNSQDVTVYGFQKPYLQVSLQYVGNYRQTIVMGDKAPTSTMRYLRKSDIDKVLLTDYNSYKELYTNVGLMRDLNISTMYANAVTAFSLQVGTQDPFKLVKKGTQWWVTHPMKVLGDQDSIKTLLDKLCGQNAENEISPTYWDFPYFKTVYGSVSLQDSFGRTSIMKFSPLIEYSDYAYSKSSVRSNVYIVRKALLEAIQVDINTLKSKKVFDIDPVKIQSIQIQKNHQPVFRAVKQGNGLWKTDTTPLRQETMEHFIKTLSLQSLSGYTDRLVTDQHNDFGVEKPLYIIQLEDNQHVFYVLAVGRRQIDRENYYAVKSEDPYIDTVAAQFVELVEEFLVAALPS